MAAPPRFKVLHWTKVAAPPVDCMWQHLPLPLPQMSQLCSAELVRLFSTQPLALKGLQGRRRAQLSDCQLHGEQLRNNAGRMLGTRTSLRLCVCHP